MRRHLECALVLSALVGTSASPATSQEVWAGAVRAWPDPSLLGSPRGFGVAVGRSFDRVALRIGLELYGDDFESFGWVGPSGS